MRVDRRPMLNPIVAGNDHEGGMVRAQRRRGKCCNSATCPTRSPAPARSASASIVRREPVRLEDALGLASDGGAARHPPRRRAGVIDRVGPGVDPASRRTGLALERSMEAGVRHRGHLHRAARRTGRPLAGPGVASRQARASAYRRSRRTVPSRSTDRPQDGPFSSPARPARRALRRPDGEAARRRAGHRHRQLGP